MKIKSKEFIKNLKDENTDLTVGEALSNILISSDVGGKMKMYVMATDFYKKNEIEVDAADLAIIKQAIEATKVYTNLVTGQLLLLLEEKSESKK